MSCSNGQQVEEYDNYVVTQIMDCSTALTSIAGNPTNPVLTYNSGTPTSALGGWTIFVANADTTNCAITSCVLKASGCGSAYSAGELTIGGLTPWTVTANQNVQAGYDETVCVSCTNGFDT